MLQPNVNRLLALISELKDFRKVESGSLKLQVIPGDLNMMVYELADDFHELALQKHIDYHIKIDEAIGEVWFDHKAVEKIITNLIHNAFKYTAVGGNITVETFSSPELFTPTYKNKLILNNAYKANQSVYIRITDTGVGISKESLNYLFERYYRINQSHIGSGIGLAFVKSLTLLHKGEIYVYSEKDQGTEIVIALPVSKDDYQKKERWSGNETGSVQLESKLLKPDIDIYNPTSNITTLPPPSPHVLAKHILIVDDNEELRRFLKESLGKQYHIDEAANGREGLLKTKELSPDLIISDVMMPEMNGIEFCGQVKNDMEISHTPFILLTAKDSIQTNVDGIGIGADYYFSKPVKIDLLLLTIRNIFSQRNKIKERYSKDYKVEIKELVHSSKNKQFMDELFVLLEERLESVDLSVDYLSQELGINRTKLNKKIKDLTGQSINEFVRSFRLKKAVEIMTSEDVSVTEVIYRIGIQSNSYFTSAFKKEYGKTPSQFMAEIKAPITLSKPCRKTKAPGGN
jgi:DNA-binding response OmpR family regulator